MAATLAEIKSRMMLPREENEEEEDDPKLALIKRLQEYQRYKSASENLAALPRVDRDFFIASSALPKIKTEIPSLDLKPEDLRDIFFEVISRPDLKSDHLWRSYAYSPKFLYQIKENMLLLQLYSILVPGNFLGGVVPL